MGLWIEAKSRNKSLIRDLETQEKTGYEFDSSEFVTYANWWFWGQINDSISLDAEVAVWDLAQTMYKANSFAANVPDVTFMDGLQDLAGAFFAPVYGLNSGTPGVFNKFGATLTTPVLKARAGYGNLKDNSMTGFTGIYNVLYPWDDVGKGFLEISTGENIRTMFDGVQLDALVGLSRMRAQYGVYSLLQADIFGRVRLAGVYGSTSTEPELFRYNEQNENAASLFASFRASDLLEFRLHGLASFGTERSLSAESSAIAFGVLLGQDTDFYNASIIGSVAGQNAVTVWGEDSSLSANSIQARIVQWVNPTAALSVGLDSYLTFNGMEDLGDGLWDFRIQPVVNLNLAGFTGKDISASVYGVANIDRIGTDINADKPWTAFFNEAGIQLKAAELAGFLREVQLDYAILAQYDSLAQDATSYDMNTMFHSVMLTANFNDSIKGTLASIIRHKTEEDKTYTPFGFAAGMEMHTGLRAIGAPRFWIHFTYGMNPYEDTDYELWTKQKGDETYPHLTYLLNSLENSLTESSISLGFIWDL